MLEIRCGDLVIKYSLTKSTQQKLVSIKQKPKTYQLRGVVSFTKYDWNKLLSRMSRSSIEDDCVKIFFTTARSSREMERVWMEQLIFSFFAYMLVAGVPHRNEESSDVVKSLFMLSRSNSVKTSANDISFTWNDRKWVVRDNEIESVLKP